jgi:hypothetical protein
MPVHIFIIIVWTGIIYRKEFYCTAICDAAKNGVLGFVIFHGKSSEGHVIFLEAYPWFLNVLPLGLASITGFPV